MKVGDLIKETKTGRHAIVIFIDAEDPDCYGVLYSDSGLWDLGWSDDWEVVSESR